MKRIIALLVVLLALPAHAQEQPPGRLTVTGQGQVASVPDMATVTLGVTSEARTAAEALDQTSSATAAILEQLRSVGIGARDMQTSDLSLSPVWDNRSNTERPRIVGYQASNAVTVRVLKLDDLGGLLGAVVDSGANDFRGLSFGLQDPEPAMDEARQKAVADAMRKARLYAEAAGITLGPILQFDESGGRGDPGPVARMAMAEAVPIAQGEVTMQASVTLVFAIDGD